MLIALTSSISSNLAANYLLPACETPAPISSANSQLKAEFNTQRAI